MAFQRKVSAEHKDFVKYSERGLNTISDTFSLNIQRAVRATFADMNCWLSLNE
jgi:hypothetical protein